MSDAIVVVAREMEVVADPAEQRLAAVGLVAADHEYDGMDPDQAVKQRSEGKPAVRGNKDGQGNERRYDLQKPGEIVVGTECGPGQHHAKAEKQSDEAGSSGRINAFIRRRGRSMSYPMSMPPFKLRTCPVMYAASSEASQRTA